MSPVLEARNTMRALALKARAVVDDTAMTMAEKKTTLDQLDVDMTTASETIEVYEKAAKLCQGGDSTEDTQRATYPGQRRSLGQQVVASQEYADGAKAVSGVQGGRQRFSHTVDLKDSPPPPPVMDEGTTPTAGWLDGAAAPMILPQFLPGIQEIRFPELVMADLFAQGTTTSPIISWVEETSFTNAAAPVAEQGQKPTSADAIERQWEQVGKIAHLLRITDEMLQDAPQYRSFLDSRMTLGIQLKEDDGLLNGTGYPGITGLLSHSALFQDDIPATGSSDVSLVADAVFNQITALRFKAFIQPDTALMNPFDWAKIRLGKDQNGQYYSGGPFTGAYGNGGYSNVDALWGMRVVQTPHLAAGTVVVGAFRAAAQIFRRQGITVEMSNSNADDFEFNRVTVRAEERLALATYRPNWFGQVLLTW